MSKYQIWNKVDPIITPANEYYTAEQYIEQFCPAARVPALKFVCAAGPVNGAFFNELESMKEVYRGAGAVFSDDMSDQEALDAISQFDEDRERKGREDAEAAVNAVTAEERIAAALEFQNLMNL